MHIGIDPAYPDEPHNRVPAWLAQEVGPVVLVIADVAAHNSTSLVLRFRIRTATADMIRRSISRDMN